MTDLDFKSELKAVEHQVKRLVSRDLHVFYDQLLVTLQDAGRIADHKHMFRVLTRLGGKRHKHKTPARPLPMLRRADGSHVESFEQQQALWLRQFSNTEAGLHISWEALQKANSSGLGLARDVPVAELFPTDWQLQAAITQLKRGKAPGPNGLTPCILKAGGGVLTKQLAALTTKVVAHGREPTTWKGGRLIPLYKGKNSTADPASYRAIYISDYTSKLYHRVLRQHLAFHWNHHIDLLQLGGRRQMGTDLAHHVIEAHHLWSRSRKTSSAVVFFDLRAAFYSVLRQALLQVDIEPTALITALSRMGISMDQIQTWLLQAQADHAVPEAGDHMEQLLRDCMTHTYFTLDRVPGVCHTTRGTRPGDPLGDLLFNLIMRLVLKDTHSYVQARSSVAWIGDPKHVDSFATASDIPLSAYVDVSFVDDAAVALHAPSLPEVQTLIQLVVEGFHFAATARGLDVNFGQGKTEVMWDIRGRGSRMLKERLHDAGQQLCWKTGSHNFQLRVSHAYKHLGSWIQTSGTHKREIAHRAGQALYKAGDL